MKFLKKISKKKFYINSKNKIIILTFILMYDILEYNIIKKFFLFNKQSKILKNNFTINAYDLLTPTLLKKNNSFNISGILKSNKMIKKLEIIIFDKNQFEIELNFTNITFSNIIKLNYYNKYINFYHLSSGEKSLNINIYDNKNHKIAINKNFTVLGKAKEPTHMTNLCKFELSYYKGNFSNIINDTDKEFFNFGNITIKTPSSKKIDGILIKFYSIFNNISIISYGINGDELNHYSCFGNKTKLHEYYELSEKTSIIKININNFPSSKGISAIRIFEKDKVGISVEKWKLPPKKCDLMVLSAHRDDELLFFGGTIPYYHGVRKKSVCTVYFSGTDLGRIREALASQWSMGINNYPIFMGFKGGYHNGINGTLKGWGGENIVFNKTVNIIRKYKPDVIVTHDIKGEYGHPTHRTVPYIIQKVIFMASNKSLYNESFNKYGIHQIKKLYFHNYYKNDVIMNWNEASSFLDGKTPHEVACIGYDKYYSQHRFFQMDDKYIRKFAAHKFELIFSIVGNDSKKNDFFENI